LLADAAHPARQRRAVLARGAARRAAGRDRRAARDNGPDGAARRAADVRGPGVLRAACGEHLAVGPEPARGPAARGPDHVGAGGGVLLVRRAAPHRTLAAPGRPVGRLMLERLRAWARTHT